MPLILKILAAALLIALAETLNGIFRIRVLCHRLGNKQAKRISLLSGCALIFALTWLLLPWIAPTSTQQLWSIGGSWLGFMLSYDLFIGRVVFRQSWQAIAEDFNLARGNYLALGMLFLFSCPALVHWLQR